MSANVTEALARFAASLKYEDLPPRVRDHCKTLLLDTLACAVAGHRGDYQVRSCDTLPTLCRAQLLLSTPIRHRSAM